MRRKINGHIYSHIRASVYEFYGYRCVCYLRRSEPVTVPVVVVVVDVVVVVEPVFIVGMTAADSFSFSLSALSSDQYLF